MQQNMTNFNRSGPHPLWLHLNAGAAMMAAVSEGPQMAMASAQILSEAMSGVQAYHDHPARPFVRDMKILLQRNGSSLITGKDWDMRNPVLLIPSLINGWTIFDIEKQFSFAAYLYDAGYTPIILDWAEPVDKDISLDDFILHHFYPLVCDFMALNLPIAGTIGYCMGGTMIAALLSAYPDLNQMLGKKILVAPPWDFSTQTPEQSMRLQSLAIQTHVMDSPVPNDFVQSLFWAIDPLQVLKKFRRFPNVTNPDRFVRVEDWLNMARPVSKSVIQTCLFDWYRDNAIVNGQWLCNGKIVAANNITGDVMIGQGLNDNLVPVAYSRPLAAAIPRSKIIQVDTGHIGLMASDKSVSQLWKPIAEFLKSNKVTL